METRVNPYIAGNPVGYSNTFVGRADILDKVKRILNRPQDNAVVLYGQRRIGKTSILQYLSDTLSQKGNFHPVYFDLQDKATWSLDRVLIELATTISYTLGLPEPTFERNVEQIFQKEWLPDILRQLENGSSIILLFDEFDVLADPKKEQAAAAFFPYLRQLLALDMKRLQFIFVIGRNMNDLDNIALSLFKGVDTHRVSLLSNHDTESLIRLSEKNQTLKWTDHIVKEIWDLTKGHPFLTQQLCSHIWEMIYSKNTKSIPVVSGNDIKSVIKNTLDSSRSSLEWLWDGLGPAERIVSSALAEVGSGAITEEQLASRLQESGVRVIIKDLQNAPTQLQEWDIIEPDNGGYRFRVELLRLWIVEYKPLRRVQEEIDHIQPVAQSLYAAAEGLYLSQQFDQAIPLLRQAIGLNPNHLGANQLLTDILLSQDDLDAAQILLDRLYDYQPAAARPRLLQTLLRKAEITENDDSRLKLYERVLEINSSQPEALSGMRRIWQKRGDEALANDELEKASAAYREANLGQRSKEVEEKIRDRQFKSKV
ncbi:MAG: AAA-like domain-containing protein, partial [Ardenticatenaceae bacterium]|nr:AAA-like domain-containing protein [Ardenticatenaceae bacterium]